MGICGFYQRFVQNYSTLVATPTDLLNKEVKWVCNTTQEQTFQKLKIALYHASTLAYPDVSRTFVVHLDASNVAIGATQSQYDASGKLGLLNCASRKFDSAETIYHIHEREIISMVFSFKHCKHYFMGIHAFAYTDSSNVKF